MIDTVTVLPPSWAHLKVVVACESVRWAACTGLIYRHCQQWVTAPAASSWLALLCLTSPPALGLRDGDMSSKAGNVSTTESQPIQPALPTSSQEFGDVSQYRELNAIGTGERRQDYQSMSVIAGLIMAVMVWGRVYYLVNSCISYELTSDRHVSRPDLPIKSLIYQTEKSLIYL